jgi:carboxymethylenebutenolidase
MTRNPETSALQMSWNGGALEVYRARPAGQDTSRVVLVIHEWWGLNDHIRDVTRRLASEGFDALAPDLYDGKTTRDAGEAGALMSALDMSQAVGKLSAVLDSAVGANGRAGVMGFCMGGSLTLALAARDARIAAAVPFYGQVPGDDVLAGLKGPVLYFAAGRDTWITAGETRRLAAYLERSGRGGEVVNYPDAEHAFFNDTRNEVYRADLAAQAWPRAVSFLKSHLSVDSRVR